MLNFKNRNTFCWCDTQLTHGYRHRVLMAVWPVLQSMRCTEYIQHCCWKENWGDWRKRSQPRQPLAIGFETITTRTSSFFANFFVMRNPVCRNLLWTFWLHYWSQNQSFKHHYERSTLSQTTFTFALWMPFFAIQILVNLCKLNFLENTSMSTTTFDTISLRTHRE